MGRHFPSQAAESRAAAIGGNAGRTRAPVPPAEEGQMADVERESMEYDVVIVGAGPAGLFRRDPAEAARPGRSRSWCWRRARRSARTSCRARCSTPSGLDALLARLARARRPGHDRGHRGPLLPPRPVGRGAAAELADAEADVEPRQLHRLDGQRLPLAGRAGRGARRRGLPRHGRVGAGLRRRHVARRRRRRVRARAGRHARAELRARDGAARQVRADRRGRARLARQAARSPATASPRAASRRSTGSG